MYTFLLVDDEPMMRKSLQLILEDTDLDISNILLARDGEEALKLCEDFTPDVIVTDVRMPKMDGLELCGRASEKYNLTTLIIISGYDDFKYAQKAMKYGVKDYLLKPVNREEFMECIKRCIEVIKNNEAKIIDSKFEELKEIFKREYGESKCGQDILPNIYERFNNLPLRYCKVLSEKIFQDIIAAVCDKTGENFPFKILNFIGNSKKDFYSWFADTMDNLNKSVRELQIDTKYFAIKLAKEYMEKNFSREFSLEDISAEIGFNPSYFSQLFKAKTGQTFVQYKNQVRLEKAKVLLEKTNKSVTQIAMDVGYNDVSHFIKIYKKIIGETPSEYRENRGITQL